MSANQPSEMNPPVRLEFLECDCGWAGDRNEASAAREKLLIRDGSTIFGQYFSCPKCHLWLHLEEEPVCFLCLNRDPAICSVAYPVVILPLNTALHPSCFQRLKGPHLFSNGDLSLLEMTDYLRKVAAERTKDHDNQQERSQGDAEPTS
ncbi:MAG: hypothetical protein ACE5OZ_11890 [Candidatus Heimdallarchaeota archaeon]